MLSKEELGRKPEAELALPPADPNSSCRSELAGKTETVDQDGEVEAGRGRNEKVSQNKKAVCSATPKTQRPPSPAGPLDPDVWFSY